jgi:hypothetical protein
MSGDLVEWKRSITELDCPEYSYELVKRAVSMSLDRSERERLVNYEMKIPSIHNVLYYFVKTYYISGK